MNNTPTTMLSLGETIRARRHQLGFTLQKLADEAGCTKGYLSTIENDKRDSSPSPELLFRLELALELPEGELALPGGWKATPPSIRQHVRSLEERTVLAQRLADLLQSGGIDGAFKSGELRGIVEQLTGESDDEAAAADKANETRSNGTKPGALKFLGKLPTQVPVVNKVTAGYPREFTDLGYPARVADDYVNVPGVSDADAFAARVVGDSMQPDYHEGDIVVFSPAAPTVDGSDCFVRFEHNAESTFKRIYFERSSTEDELIRLQPLNSSYPPRVVGREEVGGLYAAVYVVRPVAAATTVARR